MNDFKRYNKSLKKSRMRAQSICLENTKSLTKENSIKELDELDMRINMGRERS